MNKIMGGALDALLRLAQVGRGHAERATALNAFRAIVATFALVGVQEGHAQMAVPGSFAIQHDGSASYSIPVRLPPGIAGMEPQIALSYSSHGGNGQLGVGWSLSGFSSITRCPQTTYQDGARTAVNFTGTDRFCKDGQRLMLETGSYGASGAVYGTEIETFARVTQATVSGTSLPYFSVQTRDGRTYEYGNTADSRLMAKGSSTVVRAWLLDKVTDVFGNYMAYTYTADTTAGDAYPAAITYTANDTAATKLAATSKVVFTFDTTRTDMPTGYQAGYGVGNRALLTNISTFNGSTKILSYTLAYENGYDTGRKRMTSVQVCDGAATPTCVAKTTMSFPTSSASQASTEPSAVTAHSAGTAANSPTSDKSLLWSMWPGVNWFAFDFEGKGRVGFVHFSGTDGPVDMKLWHSNGDGSFTVSTGTSLFGNFGTNSVPQALYPADTNGDGIPDIVAAVTNLADQSCSALQSYTMGLYANNGTGTYTPTSAYPKSCGGSSMFVMDVDGDGLSDIVHIGSANPRTIDVSIANGTQGFGAKATQTTTVDTVNGGTWQQLDVNGDGLADLVHFVDTSGNFYVWTSTGAGGFNVVKGTASTLDKSVTTGFWYTLDLNGDGLADLVHVTGAGTAYVWMNQGNGTFAVSSFTTTVDKVAPVKQTYNSDNDPNNADAWVVTDYNGDGLADLIHLADATGDFYVWTSKGDGTFNVTKHTRTDDTPLTTGLWKGADMTGTGVVDLVHFLDDSGNYKTWTMPRVDRDVPTSINNGAGISYRFTEKTLPQILNADGTHGGSYTTDAVAAYPATQTTVIPNARVVTDSYESDGVGGDYHLGYNYNSARFERAGRRFVGFSWVETIDSLTSVTQRTTMSQAFPYIGIPTLVTRGASHASPASLSKVTYSLSCMNPAAPTAGTSCSVAAGGRYYPFVTEADANGTDLDGTQLPMRRTTVALSDLDLFGNVLKSTVTTLNPDGSTNASADFSSVTTRTFSNDTANWRLGRVLTSSVAAAGPATPAPVTPGVGSSLPPAAAQPKVPPQLLMPIITMLLQD